MKTLLTTLALGTLVLAGCKNNPAASSQDSTAAATAQNSSQASSASPAGTYPMSPEQLGMLGAQLKRQPGDADRLLAQHGLTLQSFGVAVRKVSEHPADAKRYATAYRSAS